MILSLVQCVHIPFIDKVKKTDESNDSSVLRKICLLQTNRIN